MARPRKNPTVTNFGMPAVPPHIATWAESLGEALGRGVAKGINVGLSGTPRMSSNGQITNGGLVPGRRGRPPKMPLYPVPAERRCKIGGCPNEARSKGLCSAHYQAERRRQLTRQGKA